MHKKIFTFHGSPMKASARFLLICLVFLLGCRSNEKNKAYQRALPNTKEVKSDFPIYDFEGLEPLLQKKDGKTYIVNFWATWCKPCIEELPYFEKTFEERREEGVQLLLVNLDRPSMWKKRVVPFVEEKNLQGEIVVLNDPNVKEWVAKIDENWQGAIPATLIYNENLRTFYPHGLTYEQLNTELDNFIR